jgi:hypothetical protein
LDGRFELAIPTGCLDEKMEQEMRLRCRRALPPFSPSSSSSSSSSFFSISSSSSFSSFSSLRSLSYFSSSITKMQICIHQFKSFVLESSLA